MNQRPGLLGLLNINKPGGVTSRDVVNQVQRAVRPHKVGHAGTLDPLAEGVLLVAVGKATRLVPYLQQLPKRYRGTFLWGLTSDTEDVEGEVQRVNGAASGTVEQLSDVLPQFVGLIEQMPPQYSALKVQGRRAYKLAREGKTVDLQPRTIQIHRLEIVACDAEAFTIDVECGSGTYIRSLGRDLAAAVDSTAVMSALTRTAIGPFAVTDSVTLAAETQEEVLEHLLPAARAVAHLPTVTLTAEDCQEVVRGRQIAWREPVSTECAQPSSEKSANGSDEWAGVDSAGDLVAILSPRGKRLQPTRCFI